MSEQTPSTAPKDQEDKRSSIDKAIAVLRALGTDKGSGVGVTEVARRAGLPKSTAFRILASLQDNDAVEKIGTVYRLGPMMTSLGKDPVPEEYNLIRDVLTPSLAELYDRTHQTVHLAVLDDTNVIYLNKLFGRFTVRSPSRIAAKIPAYCTGVGKVLLADNPSIAEKTIEQGMTPWTKSTITTGPELREELATIREVGIAYDREEIVSGLTCVAAPIRDKNRKAVAALSVSGPVGKFNPEAIAPLIRNVCFQASRTIVAAQSIREKRNEQA